MKPLSTLLTIVILIALGLGMITACQPTTPKEAPAPQPDTSGEAVSIRYQSWRLSEEASVKLTDILLADFNKQYPNIKVEYDPVTWEERNEKLTSQIIAGECPDVGMILGSEVPQFADQMLDLTDYWAEAKMEDQFFPAAIETVKWNDRFYAVPLELNTEDGILYNADMFEQAGLDPEKPPQYLDELVEYGRKLTGDGTYAFETLGVDPVDTLIFAWPYILQSGAELYDEEGLKKNLNSPEVLKQWEWFINLYNVEKMVPNPLEMHYTNSMDLFAQEKIAIYHGGPWNVDVVTEKNPAFKDKLRVAPLPYARDGKQVVVVDNAVYVIPKCAPNPDEAWKFIVHMTNDAGQELFLSNAGFLPARIAVTQSEAMKNKPLHKTWADELSFGVVKTRTPKYNEAMHVLWEELQNAWSGKKDPKTALQDASQRINTEVFE